MARLKQLLEFIQRRKKLVGFFTIIVLVVFFVTMSKVYHYSEKSEFCASCHEMKVHYDSFKASKHHNEHVENCHACHVAFPEIAHHVPRKAEAAGVRMIRRGVEAE